MKIRRTPPSPPVAIAPLVSRDLVRAKTREHARRAGRAPRQIKESDYERAKRELTAEPEPDLQEAIFTVSDDLRIGPETEEISAAGRQP